jgi:hypothetical protein
MTKTTPHSRWAMKTTTTPPSRRRGRCPSSEHGWVWLGTKESRSQSRSESSGGPNTYKQCWSLLLHRPAARDVAAKSYALRPVLRLCLAVGRRQCRSPKAGDDSCKRQRRRLLSSAQVVTDIPVTSTTVKLHDEVVPGAQCMCIGGYKCRSPPPTCQYTEGVPPRAAERGEKCDCPRRLPGRYCTIPKMLTYQILNGKNIQSIYLFRNVETNKLQQWNNSIQVWRTPKKCNQNHNPSDRLHMLWFFTRKYSVIIIRVLCIQ